MRRAMMAAALVLACATVAVPSARAHGGPPVVNAVIATDERGPWLVGLSEGFALRGEDGWSFVCPALFSADLPPPATAAGGAAWVAGAMDLHRLSSLGIASSEQRPDLSSARVLALGALDDALLALRLLPPRDGQGSPGSDLVLLRGDSQETLFEDLSSYWSALAVVPAADGLPAQLWLARLADGAVEVLNVSAAGEPGVRQQFVRSQGPAAIRLSVAGQLVFLHVLDNEGYSLVHVATGDAIEPADAPNLVQAALPVRGPALWRGEILLTRDEQLLRLTDGRVEPSDSPLGLAPLTCLHEAFSCTQSRLYSNEQLTAAGRFEPEAALLDLAQLAGPSIDIEDVELSRYCTAQWLVFRADLERAGILGDGGVTASDPDAGVIVLDGGVALDAALALDASLDAGLLPETASQSCGCATIGARERTNSGARPAVVIVLSAAALYVRRRRAQAA